VIRYRPFLNTDVPHVVSVWRQQPRIRGVFSSLTADLFDLIVLSKPYFDRHGLILAFDESQPGVCKPLGLVHASFGPNESLNDLDQRQGLICQLKVVPCEEAAAVADGLLAAAMDYLKKSGSLIAHVGSVFPHSPFYLGLYGGSRVPGVLLDDTFARESFRRFGFQDDDEVALLERRLAGFRTTGGRNQTEIRRRFQLKAIADPIETSWWECCLFSHAERDRFSLFDPKTREIVSSVSFWDVQPLATETGMTTRGLYDLRVEPKFRRMGIATYLIAESIKSLMQRGVGQIEVQAQMSDPASVNLFQKLGFQQVASAFQMSKVI
jgi:ribosomal protein S18 acetylase RimI-like enzyme